jgi:indole-3-glycerol phosphate synthase
MARPSEITGLAFDSTSNYLAACNREGIVQLYALDSMMGLRVLFSVTVDQEIPKAIAFGQVGENNRDVMVFGLHNGKM